ncbi:hypothetical protein AAFC00_004834 [Neodothiora populina]|uniref:Threonine/serine exporter-like N-terminal domain-containing protein n=1 Tax=Neodothiora populina TaxID=2781224 RepID=A0ABR3P4Q1_9PEZI
MESNTPPKKKRVGFTPDQSEPARKERPIGIILPARHTLSPPDLSPTVYSPTESFMGTGDHSRSNSNDALIPSDSRPDPGRAHLPHVSAEVTDQIRAAFTSNPVPKPRPVLRRGDSVSSLTPDYLDTVQDMRAREAHERGKRLEHDERVRSAPTSRRPSPNRRLRPSFLASDIPLEEIAVHSDDEEEATFPKSDALHKEVHRLVQLHTNKASHVLHHDQGAESSGHASGAVTPIEDKRNFDMYVPKPDRYRGGVLGSLLKLYNDQSGSPRGSRSPNMPRGAHHRLGSSFSGWDSGATTPAASPPGSGASTPIGGRSARSWTSPFKHQHGNSSTSSLAHLVSGSLAGASPVMGLGEQVSERLRQQQAEKKRPNMKRRSSSNMFGRHSRPRLEDEIRITIHIAETIARQRYLLKLCKALMQYGAPTHRLEEYMKMSARVLEIDAQFLYIPGSMIMSFDDQSTHTTEVKLVKVAQGLDLGKLADTHEVYKEVVHDRLGVEEATKRLEEVMKKPNKHNKWALIPVYGLASAAVGPFAFNARAIDLPIAFFLGCIVGFLQLIVTPRSDLYANVFEVGAAVITSFLARAFGSIAGGNVFCFSALAQSSIALILPGYTVLCASLELQSRSLVAGSVRMVYAIIYTLFLGFGITIGTAIYGIFDKNASSETTCKNPIGHHYFFIAVPIFSMCLIVINQAKWRQAPIMLIIAFGGYIVNFYSSLRFAGNTQVSNTLGALAIGVMANVYSRMGSRMENKCLDIWEDRLRPIWHRVLRAFRGNRSRNNPSIKLETPDAETGIIGDGESAMFIRHTRKVGYGLAAAAMLPAIFVQVPSGLAVSGSLVSGIAAANQISGNATNGTTVVNSTDPVVAGSLNNIAFNVGYSVIQVAIGITVGLFLSAIVVYPMGKRRSGLFSF